MWIKKENNMSTQDLHKITIIKGKDAYFANLTLTEITKKIKRNNENSEMIELDAQNVNKGDIIEALFPSLFSEIKVVILKNTENANKEALQDIENIFYRNKSAENNNALWFLIVVHSGENKGRRILNTLLKYALDVQTIDVNPLKNNKEKEVYVNRFFIKNNKKVDPKGISRLVEAFSSNFDEMMSIAAQIAKDNEKDVITHETIKHYLRGRFESSAFDIAEEVVKKNTNKAIYIARMSLNQGTEPLLIEAAIATKIRQLCTTARGDTQGMQPWIRKKNIEHLRSWNSKEISRATKILAETDQKLKSYGINKKAIIERCIIEVCAIGKT
jgi:DNA polymerase-3 subunit delta